MSFVTLDTNNTRDKAIIESAISKLEIEIRDLTIRSTMLEKLCKVLYKLCCESLEYFRRNDSELHTTRQSLARINIEKAMLQQMYTTFIYALENKHQVLLSSEEYVKVCSIVKHVTTGE